VVGMFSLNARMGGTFVLQLICQNTFFPSSY